MVWRATPLLILLLAGTAAPSHAGICQWILERLVGPSAVDAGPGTPVRIELAPDGYNVLVNGYLVTGPWDYPSTLVRHNLGLPTTDDRGPLRGRVLSVGEGYGDLLPWMLQRGLDARAIDTWYHSERYPRSYPARQMRQYSQAHGDRLVRGDGTRMPIADASVEHVLSHKMVNGMDEASVRAFLRETVRVLVPGGEGRVFGFSAARAEGMTEYLRETFADAVTVRCERRDSRWFHPYRGFIEQSEWLLVVQRK